MRRLVLEPVVRGPHHLVLRFGVGDLRFSTTYWYDDVDLVELKFALELLAPSRRRRRRKHLS